MENTRENIIKILEKMIESDRKFAEMASYQITRGSYLLDIVRLKEVIRLMTDQDFFETQWNLYVENNK